MAAKPDQTATAVTPDRPQRLAVPKDRFEWERIVRRCKLDHKVKLTAFVLAQYGNSRGQNIRPGIKRLSSVLDVGESTARRYVDVLLGLGLLKLVRHGGGRLKKASEYQLTYPEDIFSGKIEMLDQDECTPMGPLCGLVHSAHNDERSYEVNSAHDDERSSDENSAQYASGVTGDQGSNSAHLNPELRSPDGLTPLAQVSAHQEIHQPVTHQGNWSPQVSTSPEPPPPDGRDDPRPATPAQVAALRASNRRH